MNKFDHDQKDPYRSPDEVSDATLPAKRVGWGKWIGLAVFMLVFGAIGLLFFGTTTTFNMQRARPIRPNPPPPQSSPISSSVETDVGSATDSPLNP